MASTKRTSILKNKWLPHVFSSQFSLAASTLGLGIDNNELYLANKNHGQNPYQGQKHKFFSGVHNNFSFLFYLEWAIGKHDLLKITSSCCIII